MKQLIFRPLLALALGACSSSGDVVVRSNPVGAKVYVLDFGTGKESLLGETPLQFQKSSIATDQQREVIQLRVEKSGFQDKSPSVASYAKGTVYLDVNLSPISVSQKEVRDSFERMRLMKSSLNQYVRIKRYTDALGIAQQMVELDPKNSEAHAAQGSVLYLMRDTDGAERSWRKALELDPNSESIRMSLLNLTLSKEQSKEGT
jgi:Flp pilus assembly protein TadD